MLILSRKLNESIVIDGRIVVKILRIDKDTVKLGIQAPTELPVHRQEIYDLIQKNRQTASNAGQPTIPKPAVTQMPSDAAVSSPLPSSEQKDKH